MSAIIFSITAPTGTGKSLFAKLLQSHGCPEVVSTTTRAGRPGETDGEDYHFVTDDQFRRMVADNAFLEHATYEGNRYGVTRKALEDALKQSGFCCVVLEPLGVASLRRVAPAHGWHLETIFLRKSPLAIARQLFGRHVWKGEFREFFKRLRNALRESQWERNGSWKEVVHAGGMSSMDEHARRMVAYAEAARERIVPFDSSRTRPPTPKPPDVAAYIEVEEVPELSIEDYQRIRAGIAYGLDPWSVADANHPEHADALEVWQKAGLGTDAAIEFVALHPIRPSGKTEQSSTPSRAKRP